MIILFGKYYGKDTSEIPSSFLLWVIENWKDWIIVEACKKELSQRLKLDWQPTPKELPIVKRKLEKAENRINHLEKVILMSIFNNNSLVLQSYLNNETLLNDHINIVRGITYE